MHDIIFVKFPLKVYEISLEKKRTRNNGDLKDVNFNSVYFPQNYKSQLYSTTLFYIPFKKNFHLDNMQILIATSNGKTISLEIDPDESVHQIKQKISSLEGIPSDQQKLICDGKLLEDIQTITEYIEKDFLITLKVNEIKLQIKAIGEANYFIEAEPTDTIKNLKERISRLKNIAVDDIILSFKGKKLENENLSVAAANLKDKSLLLLVKKISSKPNLASSSTPSLPSKLCLNNCGFYGFVYSFSFLIIVINYYYYYYHYFYYHDRLFHFNL